MTRRDAFSLVEALLAVALAATLFVGAWELLFTGRRAAERGMQRLDRVSDAARCFEQLKRGLRFATSVHATAVDPAERRWVIVYAAQVDEGPPLTTREGTMTVTATSLPPRGATTAAGVRVDVELEGRRWRHEFERSTFELTTAGRTARVRLATPGQPPLDVTVATPYVEGFLQSWMAP